MQAVFKGENKKQNASKKGKTLHGKSNGAGQMQQKEKQQQKSKKKKSIRNIHKKK